MPTLTCNRSRLFELLEKSYTDEEFSDLCFQFGVELDEVTCEREIAERELARTSKDAKALESLSTEVLYKVDLPANRYDLLSIEGFSVALRVFLRQMSPPQYLCPEPKFTMDVASSVVGYRDYVVCAVLRDITFTAQSYASFIDLQEKLHQNLARKRTLVSVGTHDLDTVEGPFRYDAIPRSEVAFVPLKETEVVKGEDFVEFYRKDLHLGKYLHMIEDKATFLVIRDKNGVIMSLPPIINSKHSAISLNTKNVFIEATAVDEHKATVLVNQLICAFSLYCKVPFSVEPVLVRYSDGRQVQTPNLAVKKMNCSVKWINSSIGISQSPAVMADALTRMLLHAVVKDEDTLEVSVPPTRSDILHQCDIMEDVAIAYGYDNITKEAPKTISAGRQDPLGKLTLMVRQELAQAGYIEALTLSLVSFEENFTNMRRSMESPLGSTAVTIANPQTKEFQMVRQSLIPGLMKTLYASRANPVPIQLFEVSDVLFVDPSKDVGARNQRNLAAVYCSTVSAFEVIQGLVDLLLKKLGKLKCQIRPSEDPTFFPGRQASLYSGDRTVGILGVVHPEVLRAFQIPFIVSAVELNLEAFL